MLARRTTRNLATRDNGSMAEAHYRRPDWFTTNVLNRSWPGSRARV